MRILLMRRLRKLNFPQCQCSAHLRKLNFPQCQSSASLVGNLVALFFVLMLRLTRNLNRNRAGKQTTRFTFELLIDNMEARTDHLWAVHFFCRLVTDFKNDMFGKIDLKFCTMKRYSYSSYCNFVSFGPNDLKLQCNILEMF